ncbi:RNA_2'-phosphotransferase [Hexamita inflata]|uniref:2'-phosphotransferase n=1 Tax=Hexamita inflata TaxID=28002 RepID=A0AA86S5A5_9EUKA|nr:RNA 2'-phosphotransferase [Hexamita inflata]CAI9978290.1 RNA 2'-phosphotransferase [Hexamita inflata]
MTTKQSIFISGLLRHNGLEHGLTFDDEGFTSASQVVKILQKQDPKFSYEILESIVAKDKKNRTTLLNDKIRANQGHSGEIANIIDPEKLFTKVTDAKEIQNCIHGTYKKYLDSILESGLKPMKRSHVHCAFGLPGDPNVKSGIRQDCDVFLYIDVQKAMDAGLTFYQSTNGVILIDGVVKKDYFTVAYK